MDEPNQKTDSEPGGEETTHAFSAPGTMPHNPGELSVHGGKDVFFHVRKPRRVHWSVAWSDLMMTMFILFAVLYIYQSANREFQFDGGRGKNDVQASPMSPQTTPGDERMPEKDGALRIEKAEGNRRPTEKFRLETLSERDQVALIEDQAVRIILPADLLFDTGRADLKRRAIGSMEKVAAVIRNSDDVINVVGHTDDVPIHSAQFATNWELSVLRACQVARFLIERMKIPAERFQVSGHSYYQPARPNDSMENRAENRRVEIILTQKKH